MKTTTREEWLNIAIDRLRGLFEEQGASIPKKVRASCGWPHVRGVASAHRRIGECWSPEASADQTIEIFISPVLDDTKRVAATLVHELVHAAVGNEAGHRKPFSQLAKKVGLEKPWTATVASPELEQRLVTLLSEKYPHSKLDRNVGRKKDGTRMLKVMCPSCGYVVRVAQKWIDQGLPTCCCGQEMEEA